MKHCQPSWLVVFLIFSPLTLFGCGDSHHSEDTTAEAFPYGADSMTLTEDSNADGTPTSVNEVTFSYNSALLVTESTSISDDFNEDTGVIQRRTIVTTLYDPSLSPPRQERFTTVFSASDMPPVSDVDTGAVLSVIKERYITNAETGELYELPSRRDEYSYTYNRSSDLLSTTRISHHFEDSGITLTRSEYEKKTYEYNAAGNLTLASHVENDDTDGDGIVDSKDSSERAWQYDSYGNLTSINESSDWDGDGTPDSISQTNYANSYQSGLLMKTLVTGTSGKYQIDYVYNDAGQIESYTRSEDNYLNDGIPDQFTSYNYTYDDAGRITEKTYFNRYDSDNDGTLDYWSRNSKLWEYTENGLVSLYHTEDSYDSTPEDQVISGHSGYNYRYEYTDSGLMSLFGSEDLQDADLDGNFESYNSQLTYEYAYDSQGYLLEAARIDKHYTDGIITYESTQTTTLTYENGMLIEAESNEDGDGEGTPDSQKKATLTYDGYDRLSNFINTGIWDYSADVTLTYNDDETVNFALSANNRSTLTVDFSNQGFPVGAKDTVLFSREVPYPNGPKTSITIFMDMVDSQNVKEYVGKTKTPKILDFILLGERPKR